jgi:hypothetical protein
MVWIVDCDDADVEVVTSVGIDAIGGRIAGLRHDIVAQRVVYLRLH